MTYFFNKEIIWALWVGLCYVVVKHRKTSHSAVSSDCVVKMVCEWALAWIFSLKPIRPPSGNPLTWTLDNLQGFHNIATDSLKQQIGQKSAGTAFWSALWRWSRVDAVQGKIVTSDISNMSWLSFTLLKFHPMTTMMMVMLMLSPRGAWYACWAPRLSEQRRWWLRPASNNCPLSSSSPSVAPPGAPSPLPRGAGFPTHTKPPDGAVIGSRSPISSILCGNKRRTGSCVPNNLIPGSSSAWVSLSLKTIVIPLCSQEGLTRIWSPVLSFITRREVKV